MKTRETAKSVKDFPRQMVVNFPHLVQASLVMLLYILAKGLVNLKQISATFSKLQVIMLSYGILARCLFQPRSREAQSVALCLQRPAYHRSRDRIQRILVPPKSARAT
ncbi:uncharacterized protein F4812DRAFT_448509 [Daldinia caldariorum]|uniref:uncharacterized protein n=1 Tax=Daldinia caldariorum TaxID=326644 RepID=UPI0020086512|nr:uncharacterized protein F4812DRAFT_448509 [Daldinia caldariorum]KAI1462922.1 hypothetical protein F4812DRAFT_448509 [Daldinia caldariorum]